MTMPSMVMSRITKVLTDSSDRVGFAEAEQRLRCVRLSISIDGEQATTPAGQAAVLTAVATAMKCFGQISVSCPSDPALHNHRFPIGRSLMAACSSLGATISRDGQATHQILVGVQESSTPFAVRCWWDGWLAGYRPRWDAVPLGSSLNPLAGVFAGALSVREVFAQVRGESRAGRRESVISLWEPWMDTSLPDVGPTVAYVPKKLWIVGLGHVGQGYLWNLGFLPAGTQLVLQDYQDVGDENVGTGLVTSARDVGSRKTRVAAAWADALGWRSEIIERRFTVDREIDTSRPPIVLTALDDVVPRIAVAQARFPYLVDAGLGHSASDFEAIQVRVIRSSDPHTWTVGLTSASHDRLLATEPYAELSDQCGAFTLASASVAVPFVGACAGALVLSQAIRITSLKPTMSILQTELGSPETVTHGSDVPPAGINPGGTEARF